MLKRLLSASRHYPLSKVSKYYQGIIVTEGTGSKPFFVETGYQLHTVCGGSKIFVRNTHNV